MPRDGIFLVLRRLGSLSNTPLNRNRSFVGWGVSLTRPVFKSVCSSGRKSLLYAIDWKLSHQSEVEQSLSCPPCHILCGRLTGGEFVLQAPCWNRFHHVAGGESLLHVCITCIVLESVSSISGWEIL